MVFNPHTQQLFTDQGLLIKQMHCPFQMKWSELKPMTDSGQRLCEQCNRSIHSTSDSTDQELMDLMRKDPHICLQLDFNQNNLIINSFITL